MKRLFLLCLLLTSCHSTPKPIVPDPMAYEEALMKMSIALHESCMRGHEDSEAMNTLCFCLSRKIVNQVRADSMSGTKPLKGAYHQPIRTQAAECVLEAIMGAE